MKILVIYLILSLCASILNTWLIVKVKEQYQKLRGINIDLSGSEIISKYDSIFDLNLRVLPSSKEFEGFFNKNSYSFTFSETILNEKNLGAYSVISKVVFSFLNYRKNEDGIISKIGDSVFVVFLLKLSPYIFIIFLLVNFVWSIPDVLGIFLFFFILLMLLRLGFLKVVFLSLNLDVNSISNVGIEIDNQSVSLLNKFYNATSLSYIIAALFGPFIIFNFSKLFSSKKNKI